MRTVLIKLKVSRMQTFTINGKDFFLCGIFFQCNTYIYIKYLIMIVEILVGRGIGFDGCGLKWYHVKMSKMKITPLYLKWQHTSQKQHLTLTRMSPSGQNRTLHWLEQHHKQLEGITNGCRKKCHRKKCHPEKKAPGRNGSMQI